MSPIKPLPLEQDIETKAVLKKLAKAHQALAELKGVVAGIVRPQGQFINRVKVPVGVCHNAVAESNCVIVKWGGEQLEVKRQSVG